jgi:ethanolamine utilization cobalamin adenosyltransferase
VGDIVMDDLNELPDDWYEEETGQRLVLVAAKVLAEINRLRQIIREMEDEAHQAGIERDLLT